jgi:serine/threonine protein kinase
MGVVYLGFGADGQPVAVKTLSRGAGPDARVRMRREADLLASVESPHVAGFVAADTDASVPWLALAYVAGPSLSEASTPLGDAALRQLASGLAAALHALHGAGVIHRDVKPANVILTYDGPVLVDLGIAHTGDTTSLTRPGTVVGSAGWIAPEQLRGDPAAAATDVWGWGAVLAYGATGRSPFGDGPLDATAWRTQHTTPDLDGVAPWLRHQITTALSSDARARPRAIDLLSDRTEPPKRIAPLAETRELPRPDAEPSRTASGTTAAKAPRSAHARRRWRAVAAGATLVALLAAAIVAFSHADRPTETSTAPSGTSRGDGAPRPTATPSTATAPSSSATLPRREEWPALSGVLRAAPLGTRPPAIPTAVEGYEVSQTWKTTVRAFEGTEWSTLFEFPATMNGCSQQRFYVRWRSLNPDAVVEATFVSSPDLIVMNEPAEGAVGWQSGYGCGQPAFRIRQSTDGSTLADVAVEVSRWEASV